MLIARKGLGQTAVLFLGKRTQELDVVGRRAGSDLVSEQ